MNNHSSKQSNLNEHIMKMIKKEHPQSVKQLAELICKRYHVSQKEIVEQIMELQNQGKLSFKKDVVFVPLTIRAYLLSSYSYWYWAIIALAIATTLSVFTIPEGAYPIVYANYILGSVFVLGLPGYSVVKVLFPNKELDIVERAALSIGVSTVLVPVIGLLLSYTPWGIRVTPLVFSLLGLTTIIATAAILRERQNKLNENQPHNK